MTRAACIVLIAAFALRQVDRWWFSPHRRPLQPAAIASVADVMRLQRDRANDVTPALLLFSVWMELAGWWMLLPSRGWLLIVFLPVIVALRFRQLQEISHFAIHGALARSSGLGDRLAEVGFQTPLGLVPVAVRRRRHVNEHHPHATVTGLDPNLAELEAAGWAPSTVRWRLVLAVLHPLTPSGMAATVGSFLRNMRVHTTERRLPAASCRWIGPLCVVVFVGVVGGVPGIVGGYIVPRFMIYPMMAWLSLLVEHRWFDTPALTDVRALDEARRCLRLYSSSQGVMQSVARLTWLPYGDMFHFAHSAYPRVRWNYLAAVDRMANVDVKSYRGLIVGKHTVLRGLFEGVEDGSVPLSR